MRSPGELACAEGVDNIEHTNGNNNLRSRTPTLNTVSVTVPPGVSTDSHELRTAQTLAAHGYHVEFNRLSMMPGVKNPDVTINGEVWEFKSPLGNGKNMITHQFSRASKQASNLVIDLERTELPVAVALE